MTDKELYDSAIKFLLSFPAITKKDIEQHLQSEFTKPKDLKIIYRQFCESAQNRQMSKRVIGKAIGGIDKLKTILFDFEPSEVADNYDKSRALELFEEIRIQLNPIGQLRTEAGSLWPQYCQSIIDSAHFLKTFCTADGFYNWADLFANDSMSKLALPLILSMEITGMGLPLACDVLKEIGYSEYGKPDVHVKEIFRALGIVDSLEKSTIKQDYLTLKALSRIALNNNVTPYAVDKVFWLIGSGDFHLCDKKIGNRKKEFIRQTIGG